MFTNTSDRILKQLGAEFVLIRKACQDHIHLFQLHDY